MPHPNVKRLQDSWDAMARGDAEGAFEILADDFVMDNGPGAGPWRHIEGKEAFGEFAMQFLPLFQGTWKQEADTIYADDDKAVSLVHETGVVTSGDVFDNMAVYVYRFGADGRVNRIWTTDLAHESLEEFWKRNPTEVG